MSSARDEPALWKVALAFLTVYLIWGSTYLGVRYAIETLPGFLMAGVRYLISGAVVFAWGLRRGGERPDARGWRDASLLGALFFLGGNGAVVWGETRVASGTASLLIATMPLWLVLLDWLRPRGSKPHGAVLRGLALGFTGLCVLIGPGREGGAVDPMGAAILVAGALSWATGSIYARHARLPRSLALASGMEMMAGGCWLLLAGLAAGEASAVRLDAMSLRSLLAFAYLVVFGSIIAFSAFTYLLAVAPPAKVATYAYVNPVVAVMLGALVGDEALTARTVVGASVIVLAVALVTAGKTKPSPAPVAEALEQAPAP